MSRLQRLLASVLLGLAGIPGLSFAQAPPLNALTIEELMSIPVTSASRKEQRTEDVAAAVFVITREDIRRSGMTTLPDLLRMAPGVDVAQINASKWAVSARGSNALFANKLLVLVDGRTVYTRIFSGVIWEGLHLLLDDIERIEVIRGPGAALWGANAVNGVINIVTRSAADTQGGLAQIGAGRDGTGGAVRYGGTRGGAHYRVFGQWGQRNDSVLASGTAAGDPSHSLTTGFRADWTARPGSFMVAGDVSADQTHGLWFNLNPATQAGEPISRQSSDAHGARVLGRWVHTRPDGGSLQVQSFVEVDRRNETIGDYRRHVFDVDGQYQASVGSRHAIVAGAGYRHMSDEVRAHTGLAFTPPDDTAALVTAFVQDEIALFDSRLALTLGTQVQHDTFAGAGLQPNVRALWKGLPRQRIWGAMSRALRTPSLYERNIRVDVPPMPTASGLPLSVTILGNPTARTETVIDVEAGYRVEVGKGAGIDVTAFRSKFRRLPTLEAGEPEVQFVPVPLISVTTRIDNLLAATTRGLEIAAEWLPMASWRMAGSYTAFALTPELSAMSRDPLAARTDGYAPSSQWQVRSIVAPGTRATVMVGLFHVGRLEELQVPAYTRLDATVEWRLNARVSLMGVGHNLLDRRHAEFSSAPSIVQATEVPRSASLKLRWTF